MKFFSKKWTFSEYREQPLLANFSISFRMGIESYFSYGFARKSRKLSSVVLSRKNHFPLGFWLAHTLHVHRFYFHFDWLGFYVSPSKIEPDVSDGGSQVGKGVRFDERTTVFSKSSHGLLHGSFTTRTCRLHLVTHVRVED